jgi:hypothetical protein
MTWRTKCYSNVFYNGHGKRGSERWANMVKFGGNVSASAMTRLLEVHPLGRVIALNQASPSPGTAMSRALMTDGYGSVYHRTEWQRALDALFSGMAEYRQMRV